MVSRSDSPVALVTGSTGFTGRYAAAAYAQAGYSVTGLMNARGESVNLLDRTAVASAIHANPPDVVLHLAAIAFVGHGDVDEIYRVNIVGTRNLLEALVGLPVPPRQVILASSANVYGNADGVVDESISPQPVNDYAVSKYAMELMAQQFSHRLPLTIVRPFNYTGVGQAERFLIPKIVAHFRRRETRLELGNIDISRDFNDVRNVAAMYARLGAMPGIGCMYNICSGTEHTLMDVISMMEEISGHKLDIVVNPNFIRESEVKRLVGDPTKINELTGDISRIPLRQTLQWMFEGAS